jgi:hypothetical protein
MTTPQGIEPDDCQLIAGLHPARWSEENLQLQCRWTFFRASGPGGQNRNKVETGASVEFLPTHDIAQASERRTQGENRKVALHRLRSKLAIERRSCGPDEPLLEGFIYDAIVLWKEYCRDGSVSISEDNWDWPSLLSIVLDVIAAKDWDLRAASAELDVSSTQLVKLLKKNPLAFASLNQHRAERGKHPLQ